MQYVYSADRIIGREQQLGVADTYNELPLDRPFGTYLAITRQKDLHSPKKIGHSPSASTISRRRRNRKTTTASSRDLRKSVRIKAIPPKGHLERAHNNEKSNPAHALLPAATSIEFQALNLTSPSLATPIIEVPIALHTVAGFEIPTSTVPPVRTSKVYKGNQQSALAATEPVNEFVALRKKN